MGRGIAPGRLEIPAGGAGRPGGARGSVSPPVPTGDLTGVDWGQSLDGDPVRTSNLAFQRLTGKGGRYLRWVRGGVDLRRKKFRRAWLEPGTSRVAGGNMRSGFDRIEADLHLRRGRRGYVT